MNEVINIEPKFNENSDSKIIRIQRNLMMMEFDIEMVNKIILYFQIESENQAIDYLTKNSEGIWGHPFVPKIEEDIYNDTIDNENQDKEQKSVEIFQNMKSKIKTIKNKGISNIIYYPMNQETNESNELICEICGESEKFHIKNNINNNLNYEINKNNKEELIEDSKVEEDKKNSYEITINNTFNNSRININNNYNDNIINNNNENNNIENNDIINNNIDNNNINNNNSNNNVNKKECPICLSDIENGIELENCHHKYCRECFNNYLMDLINKNNIDKIPCPIKSCSNKEIKEDFFSKYLTEEQYFKYRTFRSQNEIARDPKKMFCPLCDGYALIQEDLKYKYDPNDPRYVKSTITCINGHNFCSCGIEKHEGDCYKDTNDFQKYLISDHVKQCPKCGFYIKKLKGCNHMTCANQLCKFEFCWLCMKEAVPGHFEYGQCKGMQFINPNSFMFKLKRNHPWIFKILTFLRSFAIILIIIFIFIFLPAIIMILGLLFLLITRRLHFNNYLRFGNRIYIKLIYFFTSALIIISLQNIAHDIVACLIVNFLLFVIFTIFARFLRMIYKILIYFRTGNRIN